MPPPHPFEHNISRHIPTYGAPGNRLIALFGIDIQKDWRGIDLEVVRPGNEIGVPRESSRRLQAAGSSGNLESITIRVQ
jgi:hypothetical protein